MDWGYIITDVIVFILTVVFGYIWKTYILPYLKDKHLAEIANIVVRSVEAAYGAGRGDEKLAESIRRINEMYNIHMDESRIVAAVESAWQTMNTAQIASGEKTIE